MLLWRGVCLIAIWLGVWLGAPGAAHACSMKWRCPISRILPGDGGQLPANMHGILWRKPCTSDPNLDFAVELSMQAPGEPARALEFTLEATSLGPSFSWVRWQRALAPGTRLVFSHRVPPAMQGSGAELDAGPDPARQTFALTVTKEAPVPQRPGALSVSTAFGRITTESIDGDCGHELLASYVDLTLVAEPESQAWRDALYIETWLDGAKSTPFARSLGDAYWDDYLGGSALGRDRDRLYLACVLPNHQFVSLKQASTIGPGRHKVQMRGFLPDGTELRTESVELELGCPEDTMDAGTSPPELKRDAAVMAAPDAADTGCAVTRARGAGSLSWLMLVLTARRRRRAPRVRET